MVKDYYNYTEYKRHVDFKRLDFKRLDFIVQSIRNHTNRANLKCLDLGCGKGNIVVPLVSLGYSMVGIDISSENIKEAKCLQITEDNPIFLVGDPENIPIKKRNFDFVVCTEVLEHLNHPQRALNSINYVLKEEGLLIVTVPNGYGPYSLIFDHFRNKVVSKAFHKIGLSDHIQAFTLTKISNLIKKSGFEFLNISNSDFISFLPILVKSKKISYHDCKLADKLPPTLVSG